MMYVSLKPEDVSAFVFWSKNYAPLLDKLETIEKTSRHLFFHFTITANKDLEPFVPAYIDAIKDYIYMVKRYSSQQVVWRFDPICITDKLSFEIYKERFIQCAEMLKGHSGKCYISFVHPYKKVFTNLQRYTDHRLIEVSPEKKKEYSLRLAERAGAYGIQLYACCNDYLLSEHVKKARCIDGRYLSYILNVPLDTKAASTRKECACTRSLDIGAYDTCAHGCLYCYANADKDRAHMAVLRHDPRWNALDTNAVEDNDEASQAQKLSF